MGKYHIHTFGCQMNFHDSEKIEAMFSDSNYDRAEGIDDADIIIFNTCTIREKAFQKAMSAIGRIARSNKNPVVAVCGCGAQQGRRDLLDRFPHIDIICGPDQIRNLLSLIHSAEEGRKSIATDFIEDDSYNFPNMLAPNESGTAYVTAVKGCNCRCSYCIVPSVRGREVNRNPNEITDEINRRLARGAHEVILLGQNVNRYRRGDLDFAGLLNLVLKETKAKRIRFVSPHPAYINDDLIDLLKDERLCPHIHLPLQSGSDKILKKMRRGYTFQKYEDVVEKLRRARPQISITTDMIVGFCTETDDDFRATLDAVQTVQFDSMFAFKYSQRPGTEAAKWKDDVPDTVKDKRLNALLKRQEAVSLSKNKELIGSFADALVLSEDPLGRGKLKGKAPDNRIVIFPGNVDEIGTIVRVRVTDCGANSLIGEVA